MLFFFDICGQDNSDNINAVIVQITLDGGDLKIVRNGHGTKWFLVVMFKTSSTVILRDALNQLIKGLSSFGQPSQRRWINQQCLTAYSSPWKMSTVPTIMRIMRSVSMTLHFWFCPFCPFCRFCPFADTIWRVERWFNGSLSSWVERVAVERLQCWLLSLLRRED